MSLAWEKPCQRYQFDTIQKATNNFDESKIIGKGGFGKVYKGLISDGSETIDVAVKRLDPESKQGVRQFETEIKMLSRFRHCRVVCLVGYCDENPEMILVYEYMSNGTLADHLYKNQESSLTWEQRLNICIAAARGLDYLHTGTGLEDKVIHLDVKSDNILLNQTWDAKIADLGLSEIAPANQQYSEVTDHHVRGTRGYIDPDYLESRKFSSKSDVYSFGVVLLEVLSGTHVPDLGVKDLADWTQQHINKITLNQIVDRRVVHKIVPNCLQDFANTVCKSLHRDPKKRPTMSNVVVQLDYALSLQKETNPSSSVIDEVTLQHFRGGKTESKLKPRLEHVYDDNEESSDHHGDVAESESEVLEDSEIWSRKGISMEEYLGNAIDIFGEPIRNKTMAEMGLIPTRESKAQIAYKMMKLSNKYDNALSFVNEFEFKWSIMISTTRCLLYNATGETLTFVESRSWGIGKPSSLPEIILNGQWGTYRHRKSWVDATRTGTVVVVYRCKYSENKLCNYVIAWSESPAGVNRHKVYCEINEVKHFDDEFWDAICKKTQSAGRKSSVQWRDCYAKVTTENFAFPLIKAILTLVNAITTSV